MSNGEFLPGPARSNLWAMIGRIGGAAVMDQAMTSLGHAAEPQFSGPPESSGGSAEQQFSAIQLGHPERHE